MKNKLSIFSLALLAVLVAVPAVAAPARVQKDQFKKGNPNRQAVEQALTNNDYSAWKAAVGPNNPILSKITADNFSKYVEARNLMKVGKKAEAQKIFQDLGLNRPVMKNQSELDRDKIGSGFKKVNKLGPKYKSSKQ